MLLFCRVVKLVSLQSLLHIYVDAHKYKYSVIIGAFSVVSLSTRSQHRRGETHSFHARKSVFLVIKKLPEKSLIQQYQIVN